MKTPRTAFPLRLALVALAFSLTANPAPAGPGADSAQRFKDDLRFLNGKLVPAKYRLRRAAGGEDAFAELQRQSDELRGLVAQMDDLGGRIDSVAGRLRYLKNYEVEPKLREVERVQRWAEQRAQEFADRLAGLQREGNLAGAKPHNGETEATCSTCQAVAAVARRFNAVQADAKNFLAEAQGQVERAVAAVGRAQQEMSEARARHGRLAEEFAEAARQYGATRGPLAQRLEQIEREPQAAATPFGRGSMPPGEVGLVPRPVSIGAGVPMGALDQLRVVTATSKTAAGTQDEGSPIGQVTTRAVSGYQFDTEEGLPPADLPVVDEPEGRPVDNSPPAGRQAAAVPLVIEPSPAQVDKAPPALKSSPPLQQAEEKQSQLFGRLEQLYAERKELARQGGAASAQNWTTVVNQISETQAQINFTEAVKRMSQGSAALDLTIRPKARSESDVIVPSPSPTPPAPTPKPPGT